MAQWDPESGKVRPRWEVSFSPWWVLVGCAIAGVVCAAMVYVTGLTASGGADAGDITAVERGLGLLGLIVGVFIVVGPALAWGLGFLLRSNPNEGVHILAFAALGLLVGFMLGNLLGVGAIVAPAAGAGAGVGRWAISSQRRI